MAGWSALACALTIGIPALSAHGDAALPAQREHVLLARQVGISLPSSGSTDQAIVVLISNWVDRDAAGAPCHFTGVVRADEIRPSFGAELQSLVFEPVGLAPGESVAVAGIRLPPPDPDSSIAPSQLRVLALVIEADEPGPGPCLLMVGAMGYEPDNGAVRFLVDQFPVGRGTTPAAPGQLKSSVPLGFVMGNAQELAHVIMSRNDRPLPEAKCELGGVLHAESVSLLDLDKAAGGGDTFRNSWPIKWTGPDTHSVAIFELPLAEFGAMADRSAFVMLAVHFDRPVPAACLKQVQATLQVADQSGQLQIMYVTGYFAESDNN